MKRSKDQHRLALEKYERVKRHAQERKVAGQSNIERLQKEYDEMVAERAENEKQVEQLWAEVSRIEDEVRNFALQGTISHLCPDGRTSTGERSRIKRVTSGVLESSS